MKFPPKRQKFEDAFETFVATLRKTDTPVARASIVLVSTGEDETGSDFVLLRFESMQSASLAATIIREYGETSGNLAVVNLFEFLLTAITTKKPMATLLSENDIDKASITWDKFPPPVGGNKISATKLAEKGGFVSTFNVPSVAFFSSANFE